MQGSRVLFSSGHCAQIWRRGRSVAPLSADSRPSHPQFPTMPIGAGIAKYFQHLGSKYQEAIFRSGDP
jgi:hypothetical protein